LSIVLDASALVKLVVEEPGSAETRRIVREALARGSSVNAPDIALAEALNALWKHGVLIQDLDEEEFRGAVNDLLALWSRIATHRSDSLAPRAVEIAVEHRVTVYDALYLALAESTNSTLLTFDEELKRVARGIGIAVAVSP